MPSGHPITHHSPMLWTPNGEYHSEALCIYFMWFNSLYFFLSYFSSIPNLVCHQQLENSSIALFELFFIDLLRPLILVFLTLYKGVQQIWFGHCSEEHLSNSDLHILLLPSFRYSFLWVLTMFSKISKCLSFSPTESNSKSVINFYELFLAFSLHVLQVLNGTNNVQHVLKIICSSRFYTNLSSKLVSFAERCSVAVNTSPRKKWQPTNRLQIAS